MSGDYQMLMVKRLCELYISTNRYILFSCFHRWITLNLISSKQSRTVFTGGEDGIIRAWKPNESDHIQDDEMEGQEESLSDRAAARARDKKKLKDEKRFRPY